MLLSMHGSTTKRNVRLYVNMSLIFVTNFFVGEDAAGNSLPPECLENDVSKFCIFQTGLKNQHFMKTASSPWCHICYVLSLAGNFIIICLSLVSFKRFVIYLYYLDPEEFLDLPMYGFGCMLCAF